MWIKMTGGYLMLDLVLGIVWLSDTPSKILLIFGQNF